jgi:hypothetical protein
MNDHFELPDEKLYSLGDHDFEKVFSCHIAKVLEKTNRNELFKV